MVVAVAGVHRVMGELGTAVEKAGKAIAEGKAQLKKNVEKVGGQTATLVCVAPPSDVSCGCFQASRSSGCFVFHRFAP